VTDKVVSQSAIALLFSCPPNQTAWSVLNHKRGSGCNSDGPSQRPLLSETLPAHSACDGLVLQTPRRTRNFGIRVKQ
jgi:hypothetical protein